MTPERRHIEQLYRGALALSGEAREAFLAHACAGDAELRRDVQRLLDQATSPQGPSSDSVAAAHEQHAEPSLIGRRLGQYEIRSMLGAGGMGEVYRAHD